MAAHDDHGGKPPPVVPDLHLVARHEMLCTHEVLVCNDLLALGLHLRAAAAATPSAAQRLAHALEPAAWAGADLA